MTDEQDHDKPDIAELARAAADAVAKLAVEVGHLVMEGVKSAWDSARKAADEDHETPGSDDPGV